MRYIGNKTRLLPFIRQTVQELGLRPGIVHDAFAGTASVGRALKADGWSVISSDLMSYSYVFQRAYVVAGGTGDLGRLSRAEPVVRRALARHRSAGSADGALDVVAHVLAHRLEPEAGFITSHFAPPGGRMYFTEENARRIDAARHALHRWRAAQWLAEDDYYLLLAGVLEGADRVANTAGVYAAYIKSWQPNAVRPFRLALEPPVTGSAACAAHLGDAGAVARALGAVDLLYIDPPYNTRQYRGYYHVPEIIARGWFDAPPRLRGKTGLPADAAPRSEWCSPRAAPDALRALLRATGARHVLVSYNSEGVIAPDVMTKVLRAFAADGRVREFSQPYRRYRADSDHAGRRYRGDAVRELLYYARLG